MSYYTSGLLYLNMQRDKNSVLLMINGKKIEYENNYNKLDHIITINDLNNYSKKAIRTYSFGLLEQEFCVISSFGSKNNRFSHKSANFSLNDIFYNNKYGNSSSAVIQKSEQLKYFHLLIQIYSKNICQSEKSLLNKIQSPSIISSYEAKNFGIIDKIL
mmetsp:Transcript_2682/g.3985  ORF Transcript_2682/g.3985 Transcript_2682/m.3985 type:complete len:159 (+) Transcript_2682:3342-3818(+)